MDTETFKYFECLVCGLVAVSAVGDSSAYSNGVGKPAVIDIMDEIVCYTCEMEMKHLDEGGDGKKENAENKETVTEREEEAKA